MPKTMCILCISIIASISVNAIADDQPDPLTGQAQTNVMPQGYSTNQGAQVIPTTYNDQLVSENNTNIISALASVPNGTYYSPDKSHKITVIAYSASCVYFILRDIAGNEVGRFDAQGGPYNSLYSFNMTNDGVYISRSESGVTKVKYASYANWQLTNPTLPSGITPSAGDSVKFESGTSRAYINTSSGVKYWVNLAVGLEMVGASPSGNYQVVRKVMSGSCEYLILLNKNNVEVGRFDVRSGPYNVPVNYNLTNAGIYITRVESGITRIKYADYSNWKMQNVTLPTVLAPKNSSSIQYISGTEQAYITNRYGIKYLVTFAAGRVVSYIRAR